MDASALGTPDRRRVSRSFSLVSLARLVDPAAPEKPGKRNEKHASDQACQEPMRPFPPVDGFELIEAHSRMALAVLRDGLVLVEFGLPRGCIERGNNAGHGLPFDDREAGFG